MGLETGTYISDLVNTNPPGTDQESQGANHLRLIKAVLQNTFPITGKAWNFPTFSAKSANYSVQKADLNTTFVATTSGGSFTFTLPTLAAGDAGWFCEFMKIGTDTNPFFIAPPTGTLQSGEVSGLSTTRRCIPGRKTQAFWTGSAWLCTRVPAVPMSSLIPVWQAPLPVGYEWPNGQTFGSSANYPDYFAVNGSGATPDLRGRALFANDALGIAAAGRITAAGGNWDGTVNGNNGGGQNSTLLQTDLPNTTIPLLGSHAFGGGTSGNFPSASSSWVDQLINTGSTVHAPVTASLGSISNNSFTPSTTVDLTNAVYSTASLNGNVTQTKPTNLPPGITVPYVLVVE